MPVDQYTLLSKAHDNIFAVGDASDIPASKAGSVAHFAMDLFPANFLRHIQGLKMTEPFDGHANCFIETGHGKGLLIDFNYETEPLPGKYPLPGSGRSRCSRRPRSTTGARSCSGGCTGTSCCRARNFHCPR